MVDNYAYDQHTSLSSNGAYLESNFKPQGASGEVTVSDKEIAGKNYEEVELEIREYDGIESIPAAGYSKLARPEAMVARPPHL